MNGEILRVFGLLILLIDALLLFIIVTGIPRLGMDLISIREVELLCGLFALGTGMLAIGLIRLHRWAAVTLSASTTIFALILSANLGYAPWQAAFVGMPIVFAMLLPLYVTVRNWSILREVGEPSIMPFYRALRSLDRLHLE